MLLIKENQLASMLKLSARTLQNQRRTGTGLPYVRIGKMIRYDVHQVEDYLRANNYNSTSELNIQDYLKVGLL